MSDHLGLSDQVKTQLVIAARNVSNVGANGVTVDLGQNSTRDGWMAARFVLNIGVLGTNGTMDAVVYQDDNSGFNSPNVCIDVDTNTNAALTQVVNSNTCQIIDVFRPKGRYLRLVMTGHTNGSLGSATADLYRANGTLPPTQVAEQYVKVREM
jgi:hypothetical protein